MTAMRTLRYAPAGLWGFLALVACGGGGGSNPTPLPTPVETPTSSAYLQDVSTQAAAVCHVSAEADAYSLEWSRATPAGPVLGVAREALPQRYHALRLSPLAADTAYHYRLRASSGQLVAEGTVTTAPLASSRPVTFAVVSDSGWHGGVEAQIAEVIRTGTPAPELLLHAGDVVYPHGEREFYPEVFFQPFARLIDHLPLFPTLGNHDIETGNGAAWMEVFVTPANNVEHNPRYYSFDWGDVHFLSLDVASTPYQPGTPQWTFVAEDLAAARPTWKIVYLHYPPFSGGPSGGNSRVQRDLLPLFTAGRVDVVVSGHDHGYQRMKPQNGVLYLIAAGGGAPPDSIRSIAQLAFSRSVNHFLRARADARSLLLEAVDVQGAVFDSALLQR